MRSTTQRRVGLRKTTVGMGIIVLAAFQASPAFAGATQTPDCGAVVTANLRLATDMVCEGDALVVDGAGTITVDLNGHTISSGGTALTISNSTLVTVKGGSASFLSADSAVKLSDLTLGKLDFSGPIEARRITVSGRTTGYGHDGQTIIHSSTLDDVRFYGVRDGVLSGNVIAALAMGDSHRTIVRGNTVGSLAVHQSDEVTVESNRIRTIGVGQSRGFHAINNQVMGTGTNGGIYLSTLIEPGLQGTVVSGNTVRDAATGILVSEAVGDVTISDNTIVNSAIAGLVAEDSRSGVLVVTGNTFKGNGFASTSLDAAGRTVDDGAHISLREDRPSTTVLLANNISRGNAGFGFEVVGPAAQIKDGGGNVALRNGEGACWGLACP